MPLVSQSELSERFPPTIYEEAVRSSTDTDLPLEERLVNHGVAAMLAPDPSPMLRTAEIARTCGVPESTIYRNFPKPLVDYMIDEAVVQFEQGHQATRYGVLTLAAVQLSADEEKPFEDKLQAWAGLYGAIADPDSVYQAGLALPRKSGYFRRLLATHDTMITRNVQRLGAAHGIAVNDHLGLGIMPFLATYERTFGTRDLGEQAAQLILRSIESE